MRVSNHAGRRRALATGLLALMLAACGPGAAASVAPATVAPTPVITPDPHLTEPATADAIFNAIRSTGLPLSISNAIGGDPNSPIVKKINAAVDNWPLVIVQYKDSATLRAALKWDPKIPPGKGNPPYAFVGLNIMIGFGPPSAAPVAPDAARQAQAKALVAALDPLLWPLEQRSVTPIPTSTATAANPSPSAKASPKPSAKPSTKP
jgi:hypothetical protein